MKHIFGKSKGEEHDFWMSYTDLMSGFLVVFIVAAIVYYNQNKAIIDKYNNQQASMENINELFQDVFDDIQDVEIMPDTIGSIRFYPSNGETEMFKTNEAIMLPNLENRVRHIGKIFVQKAMELKELGKTDLEIRIEGHTDTDGTFLHNLDLSSRRAYAVYKYIHDNCGLNPEEIDFVEKNMISVGYSYAHTVIGTDGKIDKDKSRRIEFKIISK